MTQCKVEILNIFIDQESGAPIVLLQDPESKDVLPILIAPLEASLIAIELEGKKPVRPLTHDLLVNILKELSYTVKSIVINDLKNNIYYANINLVSSDGDTRQIDSRPSDAIAIALRTRASIFVEKSVFALSQGLENIVDGTDKKTLKEILEKIDIDDAGGKIM